MEEEVYLLIYYRLTWRFTTIVTIPAIAVPIKYMLCWSIPSKLIL